MTNVKKFIIINLTLLGPASRQAEAGISRQKLDIGN